MKLRALIAEDEPICREHLRRLLEADPQIDIVAECSTGHEALSAIKSTRPDVVLLDVTLPELDGFSVLEQLPDGVQPAIVFVTGCERFALRAFERQAADYLLKPFDRDRLMTALRRVRERVVEREAKPLERLTIRSPGRISLVKASDIDWLCAAGNYVELHVGPVTHLTRATISAVLDTLPHNRFVRISRSLLVNFERVKEIHRERNGDYRVLLSNGTELRGSRKYRADLNQMLAGFSGARVKTRPG